LSSFLDKVDPTMELPQFMVASRRVGENLNAVKAHKNVGARESN